MTAADSVSTSCVFCRSKQTVVRRYFPEDDLVVLKRYCKLCRREVELWSGTYNSYLKNKRQERRSNNILKRAAERLTGD